MAYALINGKREVLEISELPIENTNPNLSVVQIPDFQEGDEINFYIIVNEVNEQGVVTSYSAVRQNPYVRELLNKNFELQTELAEVKSKLQIATETIDFLLGV